MDLPFHSHVRICFETRPYKPDASFFSAPRLDALEHSKTDEHKFLAALVEALEARNWVRTEDHLKDLSRDVMNPHVS
jgi:hypothetical protein